MEVFHDGKNGQLHLLQLHADLDDDNSREVVIDARVPKSVKTSKFFKLKKISFFVKKCPIFVEICFFLSHT